MMNKLYNSLRCLRHESATLRRLTTSSSLVTKHSYLSSSIAPSHPHHLQVARYYRGSSNSRYYEIPPPINWGIRVVPERMAFVIERFGKYFKTLPPGMHFLIPIVDRIVSVHSLKEKVINVPEQTALTQDNVAVKIDGMLYMKIEDPMLATYGPEEDPFDASMHLAQTTLRSLISKLPLEKALEKRESLNDEIVTVLNKDASAWGLKCIRYVIKDITPPLAVRQSMEMQAEAERKKRIKILESEGERDAAINKAEGERRAAILAAEGELAKANATSQGISLVSKSLIQPGGIEAAGLKIAEQYVSAFGNVAKQSTSTVFLPNDASSLSSMISQAITLYKRVGENPSTDGFDRKPDESTGVVKADTPSEELIDETIDEDKEPVFSLQNRNLIDEPGFSLQSSKKEE